MTNAQEWLDSNYPKNERKAITYLNIINKKLTGSLDLSDFANIKEVTCAGNQLTSLNVSNCTQLKEVKCIGNQLTSLDFSNNPQLEELDCSENYQLTNLIIKNCSKLQRINATKCQLTNLDLHGCNEIVSLSLGSNSITNSSFLNTISRPEKLESLTLSNNDIQPTTLDIFARFTNLKSLAIGNDKEEDYLELDEEETKIYQELGLEIPPHYKNKYNRFYGSLQPLQNLTKLESLCIEATDIDSGLEYLPNSLDSAKYDTDTESSGAKGRVYCSPKRRSRSKVSKIKEQLKPFGYNLGKWKENYRKENAVQHQQFYSAPENNTKRPLVPIGIIIIGAVLLGILYYKTKNKNCKKIKN